MQRGNSNCCLYTLSSFILNVGICVSLVVCFHFPTKKDFEAIISKFRLTTKKKVPIRKYLHFLYFFLSSALLHILRCILDVSMCACVNEKFTMTRRLLHCFH